LNWITLENTGVAFDLAGLPKPMMRLVTAAHNSNVRTGRWSKDEGLRNVAAGVNAIAPKRGIGNPST